MQIQRCAPLLNGALVGRSPLTRSVAPSRLRSRPVRVLPKRGRLPAGLPPLLAVLCALALAAQPFAPAAAAAAAPAAAPPLPKLVPPRGGVAARTPPARTPASRSAEAEAEAEAGGGTAAAGG